MEEGGTDVLHLLLSRASGHRPFLEAGLPAQATWSAPAPERLPGRTEVPWLEKPDASPNDLAAQRWGVIAPEGPEGDALLQAVELLIEHRRREQGAEPRRFRVPPDMDAAAAVRWREAVYRAEEEAPEERPKYLLLLGAPHQVSLELQHVLAHGAYVGRLHTDLEGCAAYARKVLAFETSPAAHEAPDVLLHAAADGSQATQWGHQLLVEPCRQRVEAWWKPKRPGLGLQVLTQERAGLEPLLFAAAGPRPAVLLSVAHGLGLPSGDVTPEEQRARQGALDLGAGQELSAEQVRDTPFLPGGMWFNAACFGAATPSRSAFLPWLERLAAQGGYPKPLEDVLRCLPRPGEPPFLCALPQAALANPRGPLAVLGHSDLAWLFSFADDGGTPRGRASRIASALEVLANGSRAGVALDALMRFYRDVNDDLTADYQVRRQAELDGAPDPVEPRGHGYRWMLRNDLRGYILLGDPASRLPLRASSVGSGSRL